MEEKNLFTQVRIINPRGIHSTNNGPFVELFSRYYINSAKSMCGDSPIAHWDLETQSKQTLLCLQPVIQASLQRLTKLQFSTYEFEMCS